MNDRYLDREGIAAIKAMIDRGGTVHNGVVSTPLEEVGTGRYRDDFALIGKPTRIVGAMGNNQDYISLGNQRLDSQFYDELYRQTGITREQATAGTRSRGGEGMAIPLLAAGGIGAGATGAVAGGAGAGAAGAAGAGAAGAAGAGGFWGQFGSMFGKGGGGAQGGGGMANMTGMLGGLGVGGGKLNASISQLSQMMRGPTMPFIPHLNTSQVGPNQNPGLIGLASLLQQIAARRG